MQQPKQILLLLLVLTVLLGACANNTSDKAEKNDNGNEANDELNEAAEQEGAPSVDELDPDDELTPFIERGKDLMDGSEQISNEEESGKLSCMSCHADGDDTEGVSLVGVTSEYPKYDGRNDAVITIEEKINDTIMHTLNRDAIDYDSEEMRSIVAFLTYISKGEKYDNHKKEEEIEDIPKPDLNNGENLYEEKIQDSSPDLFGEDSFTDGSALSSFSVMTNYVKNYLPKDDPASLSDQEAADISGYILSQDRPEWRKDESEWLHDKPDDLINKKERKEIQDKDFDWSQIIDD